MSQPLTGPVLKDLHTLDEHLLLREETGLDIDVVLDATSVCLARVVLRSRGALPEGDACQPPDHAMVCLFFCNIHGP